MHAESENDKKAIFRVFFYVSLVGFAVAVIKSAASAASPEGRKLNFQAVIKLPASAASRKPRGAHRRRLGKRTMGAAGLPWDSWRLR